MTHTSLSSSKGIPFQSNFIENQSREPNRSSFNRYYDKTSVNNGRFGKIKEKIVEEKIKETAIQIEMLNSEIKNQSLIFDELIKENLFLKDEYKKLKESASNEIGQKIFFSSEFYEKNFIKRMTEIKMNIIKKEQEIQHANLIIKNLENENKNLKRDLDGNSSNSPNLRKDVKKKIDDLEAKNFNLIKEINILKNTTKKH